MVDGLTQGILDEMGLDGVQMFGGLMEAVTYHAQAGPNSAPTDHTLSQVHFEKYQLHQLTTGMILQEDRQLRVLRSAVSWALTVDDRVTRLRDGTRWIVMSTNEGENRIWHLPQLRRSA